jgi:hypothetical protein
MTRCRLPLLGSLLLGVALLSPNTAMAQAKPRGQNVDRCPTTPLPLYRNLTAMAIIVSGDLVVTGDSCPLRLTFTVVGQPATFVDFAPGTDEGISVTVPAGAIMTGECVQGLERRMKCHWTFTRTSP